MTGLSKKLLIVLIPTIVILIGCLGLLLFLPDSGGELYVKQINAARLSVENGDYEKAILCYKTAIDNDDSKEDAYLELARIYFRLNRTDDCLNILRLGISKTNSIALISLLNEYEVNGNSKDLADLKADLNNSSDSYRFNSTYADILTYYTYDKYALEYTVKSDNAVPGVYTISYSQIDASFEYADSNESKVINPSNSKPYGTARPTMIRLNKLSVLIPGVESGVTTDMLKKAGAIQVKVNDFDKKLNSYTVSFEYMSLKCKCACDKNGTIKGDNSYNEIIPPQVDVSIKKVTVSGKIIDATTGSNVNNVSMIFRLGKGKKSGTEYSNIKADDGNYYVELEPGDYTIEFIAEGYNQEFADIYVASNKNAIEQNFTMSPKLGANEIRFVLEWGDTPEDLDSHLTGTYNGSQVNVNFMNPSCSIGGTQIADLDIDEITGFGPETITLHKTNGQFVYKVHRYSYMGSLATSGATVKIYTSNSATPIVVSVPDNVDSEWWTVCTVTNGQISNINGKQS